MVCFKVGFTIRSGGRLGQDGRLVCRPPSLELRTHGSFSQLKLPPRTPYPRWQCDRAVSRLPGARSRRHPSSGIPGWLPSCTLKNSGARFPCLLRPPQRPQGECDIAHIGDHLTDRMAAGHGRNVHDWRVRSCSARDRGGSLSGQPPGIFCFVRARPSALRPRRNAVSDDASEVVASRCGGTRHACKRCSL